MAMPSLHAWREEYCRLSRRRTESGSSVREFAQREYGQFQAIARAGLRKNALQVPLHRVLTDAELRGDITVLHAARYQERYLPLPLRQSTDRRWLLMFF